MAETDLIDDAHELIVKTLYANFFQAYTAAKGNTAEEADAERRFREGLLHARHVRDRAMAVVP